jgi:hypothetical protein
MIVPCSLTTGIAIQQTGGGTRLARKLGIAFDHAGAPAEFGVRRMGKSQSCGLRHLRFTLDEHGAGLRTTRQRRERRHTRAGTKIGDLAGKPIWGGRRQHQSVHAGAVAALRLDEVEPPAMKRVQRMTFGWAGPQSLISPATPASTSSLRASSSRSPSTITRLARMPSEPSAMLMF